MVEFPELNWNVAPINGTSSLFFTAENYDKYSYSRTFEEERDVGVYLKKKYEEAQAKFPHHSGSESETQSQADSVGVEKRYPVSSGHAHSAAGRNKDDSVLDSGKLGASTSIQQQVLHFPRKSWLNSVDQRRYLELYNRYSNCLPQNPTEEERIEMNILKELQTKVTPEQEEFQSYLKQVAECNVLKYNYMQPGAKKYMEEKINHLCKRVRQYPRYYEAVDAVSLAISLDQKEFPPLVYVRPLLELGQVPKVILPNMLCGAKPTLSTDYDKVAEVLPPAGKKSPESQMWNKQACSLDWNAEVLAQKYGCKIVLSSGALKCILDNHALGYRRDWQLPVVVKEYPVTEKGKTFLHKVVFVDKPFVNQKMTVREKSCTFHKAALKSLVCNALKSYKFGSKKSETISDIQPVGKKERDTKHPSTNQKAGKEAKELRTDSAEDFFGGNDLEMENLETFGTSKELNRKEGNLKSNMHQSQSKVFHSVTTTTEQSASSFDERSANQMTDGISAWTALKTGEQSEGIIGEQNKISAVEESHVKPNLAENMFCWNPEPGSCVDDTRLVSNMADFEINEEKILEQHPADVGAVHLVDSTKDAERDAEHKGVAVDEVTEDSKDNQGEDATGSCMISTNTKETDALNQKDSALPVSIDSRSNIRSSEALPVFNTMATTDAVKSEPINDEWGEEVIVVRRRRGRPRKRAPKPEVVKKEVHVQAQETNPPDSFTAVQAAEPKEVEVHGGCAREEKPYIATSSPKEPAGERMCLRRSTRGITPIKPDMATLPVQHLHQGVVPSKGYLADSQFADSSEDERLVIADLSPSPNTSPEEYKKCKNSQHPSAVQQSKAREITGNMDSTDEESQLFIDAQVPQLTEAKEKALPRRRSLRISGLTADSTDMEAEAQQRKRPQRRVRKSRASSNAAVEASPVDSSDGGTERRRSGRLVALGTTRAKEELPSASLQEKSMKDLHRKPRKPKNRKTRASDIVVDQATEEVCIGKVEFRTEEDTSKKDAHPVVVESSRNLSEIEEIQEPSDLSEPQDEPSLPIIIPLSPVYSRSTATTAALPTAATTTAALTTTPTTTAALPTAATTTAAVTTAATTTAATTTAALPTTAATAELAESHAENAGEVQDNHSPDAVVQSVCTRAKRRRTASQTKKLQDPLEAILKLQDKMLGESPGQALHSPSLPVQSQTQSGKSPGLLAQSKGIAWQSQGLVTHSQSHPAHSPQEPVDSEEPVLRSQGQSCQRLRHPVKSPGLPVQSTGPATKPLGLPSQSPSPPTHAQTALHQAQVHAHTPGCNPAKENPLNYHQPLEHLNVTYHLWSLGGMPLLIRCSCHGFRRDGNQRVSYLTLCTKMEYQTNYGMEQTTPSEVLRNWVSSYIRQNCPLVRARVNAQTSELVMLEEMDARRIVPQHQTHLLPQGLQRLNKVLSKLDTLAVGSYLLGHSAGDTHCTIRKATEGNKRAAYDLHFAYTGFTCTDTKLPTVPSWIPIDPAVVLPFHWKNNRIPATFEPADFTAVANIGRKRSHFQSNHTKGGPKKKKKKKHSKK